MTLTQVLPVVPTVLAHKLNSMKKLLILPLLLLAISAFAQSKKELRAQVQSLNTQMATLQDSLDVLKAETAFNVENKQQKLSYALGMSIASGMQRQEILDSLDLEIFVKAFEDTRDNATEMNEMEAMGFLNTYFEALQKAKTAEMEAASKAFHEELSNREDITTLPSGLQYEVLKEGEGESPDANDEVTTHYKGMLTDGTVFDSSYERDEPATFPLNRVIEGWQEALQLMKPGSKWKIYLPYDLGYGAEGAGEDIPPYASLIFEIELLDVKKVD